MKIRPIATPQIFDSCGHPTGDAALSFHLAADALFEASTPHAPI